MPTTINDAGTRNEIATPIIQLRSHVVLLSVISGDGSQDRAGMWSSCERAAKCPVNGARGYTRSYRVPPHWLWPRWPPTVHTLLIAEDDRAVRDSLVRALGLEGYHVVAAGNGAEALDLAGGAAPDVVVLDVSMPIVDGLTVCKVLRADGNRVPILMLTARTETRDRVAGLDAGADDYLPKPFELDELLARLRALLRRRSRPRHRRRGAASTWPTCASTRPPAGPGGATASWSCRRPSSTCSSCSCATRASCSTTRRSTTASGTSTSAPTPRTSPSTSATSAARPRPTASPA